MKTHFTFLILFCFLSTLVLSQQSRIEQKLKLAADYTGRKNASAATTQKTANTQSITYSVSAITYAPYTYTGTVIDAGTDDIWSSVVNIGFNFCYFGNTYNTCLIGANGQLTFNTSDANGYNNWQCTTMLPSTADMPGNTINAVFRDIDVAIGGVTYVQTLGTAPNRYFVVSWDSIPLFDKGGGICDGTHNSSFQCVLYESTNYIDINIGNSVSCAAWNSGYGIIGIQDSAATVAFCPPGRNRTTFSVNGTSEAWRFMPSGCVANTNCFFNTPSAPICYVSADSVPDNIVYFNHTTSNFQGTIIYRKNSLNTWDSIGYVPSTQPDSYIDLTGVPNQQAYTYCTAQIDSCGNIRAKSPAHTTVLLQSSLGTSGQVNLSWNAYVGISVPYYYIFRGASPQSMSLLAQVSSTTFAYTDLSPLTGNSYYKIAIPAPSCSSNAAHDTLISSNYRTNGITGIANINNSVQTKVYPNPAKNILYVQSPEIGVNIEVTDILGKMLHSQISKTNAESINIQGLTNGVYFVRITDSKGTYYRKFLVEQ